MKTKFKGLKLSAISATVPRDIQQVSDFYQSFGEEDIKRVSKISGIESMHIAGEGITTEDLCADSAVHLMNELNVSADSIDAIIFVSQTPTYRMPATSCVLQNRLGLSKRVLAFDINYGCSGYIYGLYQAAMLLQTEECNRVLVCAGDTLTKYVNPDDHKCRLLFGDAGTTTLVEKGVDTWFFDIQTDGSGAEDLVVHRKHPQEDDYLFMNGNAIMEFALREVARVIDNVLKFSGLEKDEINHFILHQANQFMLNCLRKKIGVSKDSLPIQVKGRGNTGPASVPLAIVDEFSSSNQMLGQSVLCGFGVGLSWGACTINLSGTKVLPVNILNS